MLKRGVACCFGHATAPPSGITPLQHHRHRLQAGRQAGATRQRSHSSRQAGRQTGKGRHCLWGCMRQHAVALQPVHKVHKVHNNYRKRATTKSNAAGHKTMHGTVSHGCTPPPVFPPPPNKNVCVSHTPNTPHQVSTDDKKLCTAILLRGQSVDE